MESFINQIYWYMYTDLKPNTPKLGTSVHACNNHLESQCDKISTNHKQQISKNYRAVRPISIWSLLPQPRTSRKSQKICFLLYMKFEFIQYARISWSSPAIAQLAASIIRQLLPIFFCNSFYFLDVRNLPYVPNDLFREKTFTV